MTQTLSSLKVIACLLSLLTLAACDLNEESDDNRIIIEPPMGPSFAFGEDGVPVFNGTDALSPENKDNITAKLTGYGWKWLSTARIHPTGYVATEGFFDNIYGLSPSSYVFTGDTLLTSYHWSDAHAGRWVSQQVPIKYDTDRGIVYDANGKALMRLLSLYQYGKSWYLIVAEYLADENDGTGDTKPVWGVSEFVRVSAEELSRKK